MESQKSSESTSSSSGEVLKEQMQKQKQPIKKLRYQRLRNGEYKRQNYGGEDLPST